MSVAKVTTIQKSRKDQGKCGNCGTELPAGTGYLYWMPYFRSNTKSVRCLEPKCYPPESVRESGKAATIYAAQEAFAENIHTLETKDEIEAAVQEVADAVEEVREEYQSALDAWENGNEQLQEKVDHYESQASEIEGWQFDGQEEWERCDDHYDNDPGDDVVTQCEACLANQGEWLDEIREAAQEKVNEVETI